MKQIASTPTAQIRLCVCPRKSAFVMRLLLGTLFLLRLGFGATAEAGLKIYFVRHAEYGGNVVDQWKNKPKDQWPSYVGKADVFTPTGVQQVQALTRKLDQIHFDFIAVSPAWRCRNTIAPYLKQQGRTAEIWPELLEFNTLSHQHDPNLPPPSANLFTDGWLVTLSSEDQGLFMLRPDNPKQIKIGNDPLQAAADRRAVVDKDIEMIRTRFDHSDKTILLVGHGNSARIFAEELTHEKKAFEVAPRNTGMWMAEEQPDGSFRLLLLNDEPFTSADAQNVPVAH